ASRKGNGTAAVENPAAKPPDASLPYYVDYCVFMRSRPIPFEQYSDDFDIRGYMGQWVIQDQDTLIETWSHPGWMTWTLFGPTIGTGIAPVGADYINLEVYKPPWEMEICFDAPDDSIPWNFYMNFQAKTAGGKAVAWFPGVQNLPKEKRHIPLNSNPGQPNTIFNVEFADPVPESILAHKPLYMLL